MKFKIAKVVVGLPLDRAFDYTIGPDLRDRMAVGMRVSISFNRRRRVGFVVGLGQRSAFKRLNPVIALLDDGPVLDARAIKLAEAFSAYYGCSLGEAIEAYLPRALRHGASSSVGARPPSGPAQKKPAKNSPVTLIHDPTRHKRWPLIITHIQKTIVDQRGVIVLVPEAVFIPGTITLLSKELDCPVVVWDRGLTPKNELALWERIRRGECPVVIGTRSAVFAPLPRLGLIVIDEEENRAYKQEQSPHYHVNEVAQMRRSIEACGVIFTGCMPSPEIWEQAKRQKWIQETFVPEKRAAVQAIDMTNYNPGKTSILSFPLQNAMRRTLDNGGKAVLFMNRLGFSTRTHCQQCGFTVKCPRCDVNLTYLYSQKRMVCRHCRFTSAVPKMCPACQGSYLHSTGMGIEKLESEAARLYPGARVGRYDRDSKTFPEGADILITTQAVFRQHERPTVSLVAMLNFDSEMHHLDFRAGHRAFSLLVHLARLAGETLIVQTRMVDNYCLRAARQMNFSQFYRHELKLRKELGFPPYRHLVAVGLRGRQEDAVFDQSKVLFDRLAAGAPKSIEISDPHPAVHPKLRDKYRFTILLKGKSVKGILALIKSVLDDFRGRGVTITVNVDP